MMLQSVTKMLTRSIRRIVAETTPAVQAPLLDEHGLQELALYARSLPWSLLAFRQMASHPLIGETPSVYRGRGLEFQDNRAYQPGDEPRLLNWRLYARTGELYTRVFTEERRPQVFMVVDRRAAMRFASRRQLKVTLAAKIAACYAWQSQQQGLAVGGMLLNQTPDWIEPAVGENALQNLLQTLIAASPPLPFDSEQPELVDSLRLLLQRLPAGSFLLLVSDFADLDSDHALKLLPQLAERYTVQAIQILDAVEARLPSHGDFLIDNADTAQALAISSRDELLHTLYADAFSERQAQLASSFSQCGIPFKTCTTEDELHSCLKPYDLEPPDVDS